MSRSDNRIATTAEKFFFEESLSSGEKLALRNLIDASGDFSTNKAIIVDGDKVAILDSAASDAPKHSLWSLVKSTLKTHFDTLYAAVSHTHVSADITDAVSAATPSVIVKRGSSGQASFGTASGTGLSSIASSSGTGVFGSSVSGTGVSGSATSGTAGNFASDTGVGAQIASNTNVAALISSDSGTGAQITSTSGTGASIESSSGDHLNVGSGKFVVANDGTASIRTPIIIPAASAIPATNGNLVIEATSNTSLTLKLKGSDGTVRSVSLTLT